MSELIIVAKIQVSNTISIGDAGLLLAHCQQPATSYTSQCSHHVQSDDILRYRASKTTDHEGGTAGEEASTPPKDIREASIERLKGSAGNEV
jgi:hypothetical protein